MKRKHERSPATPEGATSEAAPEPSRENVEPGAGVLGPDAASAEIDRLRAREDELLRALAEQQNMLRRRRQEMDATVRHAQESLVRDLLPVLDDFERAVEALRGAADSSVQAGIALVHERLARILEGQGLQAIRPEGERFDPALHDALEQRPAPGSAPGTILEVAQPGYRYGDRVLRHAKVVVAGPADAGEAAPLTSENAP